MVSKDSNYFSKLSRALQRAGVASPVLVVDKALLDHNISCLKETLNKGYNYRVVAKSLPSIPMLEYVLSSTGSNRLMCFHLPFLAHVAEHKWTNGVDLLLGKPMPIMAMKAFYQWFAGKSNSLDFYPEKQIQWLIDSLQRLDEYDSFAKQSGNKLKLNLEIDVGLHRGGFNNDDDFKLCLQRIKDSESLELSGLMGYDIHVSRAPRMFSGTQRAADATKKIYEHYVELIDEVFGSHKGLYLNAGGSPTYPLYERDDIRNEIAIASALVKPSDFDLPELNKHIPAAFIASPILKKIDQPSLPLVEWLSPVVRSMRLLPSKACFIYGGNWLADPCYPENSKRVKMFGHSSNQEMYSLPGETKLDQNDYVFFRPRQSESVFLQFGQIAVYDEGEIVDWWPVFDTTQTHRYLNAESAR